MSQPVPEPDVIVHEGRAVPVPDITRDRMVLIQGGALTFLHQGILELFSDAAPVWVNLIPAEPTQWEKDNDKAYPRERAIRVLHEMYIGTVDEIVADYKAKLTAAWHVMTLKQHDGSPQPVIPSFNEPSLRKQTETLERHGLNRFVIGGELKADKKDLEAREAKRAELNGIKPRQDGWTRWELMRLVAQWHNRRFPDHSTGPGSGITPPTDNVPEVDSLINALITLKEDREALNKHRGA